MCSRCKSAEPSVTRNCAFDRRGLFTKDNAYCETVMQLRGFTGSPFLVECGGKMFATLYIPQIGSGPFGGGGIIAMVWRKGSTTMDHMIRVDAVPAVGYVLTAEDAENALRALGTSVIGVLA